MGQQAKNKSFYFIILFCKLNNKINVQKKIKFKKYCWLQCTSIMINWIDDDEFLNFISSAPVQMETGVILFPFELNSKYYIRGPNGKDIS